MASLSKIVLLGRAGKDAVLSDSNGTKIAKFSIATESYAGKKDGKNQYTTDWWDCTVFGQQAEYVGNNLKKGQDLYLEGELKLAIGKQGDKIFRDVNVAMIRIVSRPAAAGSSSESFSQEEASTQQAVAPASQNQQVQATAQRAAAPAAAAVADIGADDLPF